MLDPWQTFASGVALGFSIAAPPGPVNATAAYQVSTRSWAAGWWTVIGATTADGIFFILTYYGLTRLISSGQVRGLLFAAGGCLMLYLAFVTLRRARRKASARRLGGGRAPYLVGISIGLSNPYQIAWWLTVGIGMVTSFGLSILAGFFAGIVAWNVIFTWTLHAGLSRYERGYALVVYASGAILLAFAFLFLFTALGGIF